MCDYDPTSLCPPDKKQSAHDAFKPFSTSSERSRLSAYSSTPLLAKLRLAILEHLKDLETKLSQLDPHLMGLWEESDGQMSVAKNFTSYKPGDPGTSQVRLRRRGSLSATAIQETRAKVRHVLDMLGRIRSDVYSYLPEIPSLDDMRSGIPTLQDFDIHLRRKEIVEGLMSDKVPASYLPTLKSHLDSLHEHIRSLKLPSSCSTRFSSLITQPSSGIVADLMYKLQDPSILTDPLKTPWDIIGTLGESRPSPNEITKLEHQFNLQVQRALEESNNGRRLITYEFVPLRYQNNHYLKSGYRFIPPSAWPRLILSIFQFHNDTANILTHLIPLLYSLRAVCLSLPPFPHFLHSLSTNFPMAESAEDIIGAFDIPNRAFVFAANFCLLCSCIWHTVSGCSDLKLNEIAAKIDYIGIGWLISASSATVVYYGFGCRPTTAYVYIILAFCQGIAGSILPFKAWFNAAENKNARLMFFVSLAVVNLVPLTHLAAIHSISDMYLFIRPETSSILSYIVGVIFYAFHIPERFIPDDWKWCTDLFGGGSHAIWHICIVFAIHFHAQAMVHYRNGVGNETFCQLTWHWSL